MSVPDASALHVGDTFTIEAWVKRGDSGTGQNEVIASKQDGDWVLMFNGSDQLTLRRSDVADVAYSSTTVTDTSQWHYVVATKSGSSVHLYVDGSDVTGTVSNQTMVDNTEPLAIGQSTGGAYFKGEIADVALYNTALTAQQVSAHYQAGTGSTGSTGGTGGTGGSGGTGGTGAFNPNGDPVIAAASDIACSPSDANFDGGTGSDPGACQELAVSNLMIGGQIFNYPLAAVLPLGDEQYDDGTYSEFTGSYAPTWGRYLSITHPVPGNHEYYTAGASGYFDYFDGVGKTNGFAGSRGQGYYSYNIGAWHLIALNSNCDAISGGCGKGSPEEKWLLSDLKAHPSTCTLAYWHHPLFHSGPETGGAPMQQIFTDLYNANVSVVLNGHEHMYERFAPQTPSGQLQTNGGIREFIVATGGLYLEAYSSLAPNSQAINDYNFGVLELALHPTSYSWQFVPVAGGTFHDSGTASCHTSHSGAIGSAHDVTPRSSGPQVQPTDGPPLPGPYGLHPRKRRRRTKDHRHGG